MAGDSAEEAGGGVWSGGVVIVEAVGRGGWTFGVVVRRWWGWSFARWEEGSLSVDAIATRENVLWDHLFMHPVTRVDESCSSYGTERAQRGFLYVHSHGKRSMLLMIIYKYVRQMRAPMTNSFATLRCHFTHAD